MIVLQCDLNSDYKKNIAMIEDRLIDSDKYMNSFLYPKESVPVIQCHFAMHYLLASEKDAKNIAAFISHYLAKGGIFIITIFDGQRVFDLLKQNRGKWQPNEHYMIRTKGVHPKTFHGFGHKIEVLLPMSNELYTESLIDLFALDKIFKDNKIFRLEERNFSDMLDEYISNNTSMHFNDVEKTFISLYKYVIYKKS